MLRELFPITLYLVPALPLAGALACWLFARSDQRNLIAAVGNLSVGASFLCSIAAYLHMHQNEGVFREHLWTWIPLQSLTVSFEFYLDALSGIMILTVTGVSFLIHLYSIEYMEGDESYGRYFSLLNLFVFFMTWLVLSDNLIMLFVGWEGVALCSWALIGFWFTEEEKAEAGNKAFLVNRVGDVGLLIGLFLLVWTQVRNGANPTLRFAELVDPAFLDTYIEGTGTLWQLPVPAVAGFCLLLGATGKSAQIPLYVWLPDAMAGPTPVSALIHAATMVTAGVYLICRLSALFMLSTAVMSGIAMVGGLTLVIAAVFACFETDFKRILAYSTISQIGYMFLGVGTGAFAAGMFHLVTHAFFKALLFLGAGVVLHALSGVGDIREMGGLRKKLPVTFWTFVVASLALVGIPPFAGFWSKDEILWYTFAGSNGSTFLWCIGLIGVFLTAVYTFRLLFVSFTGPSRVENPDEIHKPGRFMTVPMVLLAIASVLGGILGLPHKVAHLLGTTNWMSEVLSHIGLGNPDPVASVQGLEMAFMGITTGVALLGIGVSWWLYVRHQVVPGDDEKLQSHPLRRVFQNKLYVDEIGYYGLVRPVRRFAKMISTWFETIFLDTVIVNGSALVVRSAGWVYSLFQNGRVGRYLFWIWVGLGIVLFVVLS